MTPLLSLLVATVPPRAPFLARLLRQLQLQAEGRDDVQILVDDTVGISIGTKRAEMIGRAQGKYVAFIDDDDLLADDYVARMMAACAEGKDCCSLMGRFAISKQPLRWFEHSIKYGAWSQTPSVYLRNPNHLNAVRRDLAVQAGYPDLTYGEDHAFAKRVYPLLKTEASTGDEPLYFYMADEEMKRRMLQGRLLIKWPTRGRPVLFAQTLAEHRRRLSGRLPVSFLISVDEDDATANDVEVMFRQSGLKGQVVRGPGGRTKVQAINADIPEDGWDFLLVVADDMVPVENDYDERIAWDMMRVFPHLDGLLVYDDGFQGPAADGDLPTATMPVMGRNFYRKQGYVYHPEYTSLWCDNELTEVAKRDHMGRRIPRVIIRHDWIGRADPLDALVVHNNTFFQADKAVFERRKAARFPKGQSVAYSQSDEETFIVGELGDTKGRFLDIGAYNGKTFSNTLRLVELGWGGVLVEPAPGPFQAALALHRGNNEVRLIQAAVAPKGGLMTFRDSRGDAVSTLSEEHAALWSSAVKSWDEFLVPATTPGEIIRQVGADFDFVSLDVEGTNLAVFKAIPWGLLATQKLRLVCVEHEGHQDEMERELAQYGFERCYENAENVMFRRKAFV